jgi:hypothetical protein
MEIMIPGAAVSRRRCLASLFMVTLQGFLPAADACTVYGSAHGGKCCVPDLRESQEFG